MSKLVLLRHGESAWNRENRFAGWTDVDLSEKGIDEAKKAGQLLKNNGFVFDIAFTSTLKRAIRTLWIVLDVMDLMWISVNISWRLNERHYGALQGLSKSEFAAKYGEEQVRAWRRSYDVAPPAVAKTDSRYPKHDPRYGGLSEKDIPLTESLKDTIARVIPYWNETIAPALKAGKRTIISSHGNTLRALTKYLDNIPDDEIVELNIPTGIPLVYELDENLNPVTHYYLGDQEQLKKAMQAVADQGKAGR